MFNHFRLPLSRLLASYLAGIAVAHYLDIESAILWVILAGLFILQVMTASVFFSRISYTRRWLAGIPVTVFIFFSAFLLTDSTDPRQARLHFCHSLLNDSLWAGRVTGPVTRGASAYRSTFSFFAVKDSLGWRSTEGSVMLYLKDISNGQLPRYGDTLLIRSRPREVKDPLNPGQFNYRKYLATQRIYHQVFATPEQCVRVRFCEGFSLQGVAIELRTRLSEMLQQCGLSGSELGIAEALLVGDKSHLDQETYDAFSASGTIHILCVSGMHVGVIFMLLNVLLAFLKRNLFERILRTVLILTLIWFYALLTGLTPSVLRASAMFSFLAMGLTFRRNTNVFNTLAASALVLLLADPLYLNDKGFQLSYLAVVGILVIQPWMQNLIDPPGWLAQKMWSMITVTVSAQIATFPLTVHLFHQFPVYFIFSNLAVIPLSGLLIYLGIILVAVYPVTFLRNIISTVFTYLISLLDRTVRWFETLPHATWNGIFLPAPEMVLIYAMILSGILLFVYCKPKALLRLLFFICLFQASMLWRDLDRYNRRILAVYASSRSTVIGLYHGDKGLILLDSNSFNSRETKMGIVSSHLTGMGITEFAYEQLPVMSGSGPDLKAVSRFGINCCQFGDKRICIIDRELPPMTTSCRRIQADLVILRNDKTIEMKDVLCLIDAPLVVVDASVPVWIASRWKKEFPDKVFVVAVQGAYVKKWK